MITSLMNARHDLKSQITTLSLRTTPELVKTIDAILVSHKPMFILATQASEEQIVYSQTFIMNHTIPSNEGYTTLLGLLADILSVDSPTNRCSNCFAEHSESSDLCEGCAREILNAL